MVDCGELPWLLCGEHFPAVYHGGKKKVRDVDPGELQKRDPGFYGKGFYVTTERHYARTYGHIISEYRFSASATILDATLKPQDAPADLARAVIEHIDGKYRPAAAARGKEKDFEKSLFRATQEPLDWRDAVVEYALDLGIDAIAFSRGEIVVRTPGVLTFVR